MEPITAGWMITTILSGVIGGRGDFLLCKGFDKLRERITQNLNEPANHHIQKGIRKSYLNATLLAVEHIQKQRKKYSLSDRRWNNLKDIKVYIKGRLNQTEDEESYVRGSNIDGEYRSILFPKEGMTSEERKPELILKLKESIIKEFEANRLLIEDELKSCIYEGWKEGTKDMDFYKLTCAFFTQELKDNAQLSTYIQTEYLDHIKEDLDMVSLKIDDLKEAMHSYYKMYESILSTVDDIFDTVKSMDVKMDKIPEKTAQLIFEGIESKVISRREITISDEYQEKLKTLDELENDINTLKDQINGLKQAILQVDEHTKPILEQNLSNIEIQLIEKGNLKDKEEKKLNEFVSNVIDLAKQLQSTQDYDSQRLKQARQLFSESKFDEVNSILNEKDIDRDIEKVKRQQENSQKRLKELANELSVKAKAIILNKPKGWFIEADRLYSKSLATHEDYNTTFNYAYFLNEHHQVQQAIDTYKKAISHSYNDIQKADILNNLAVLYREKNEYNKAEEFCDEALGIYEQLAKENPQTHLTDVAKALNNLAILQFDKSQFDKAEQFFEKALEIRRQLARVNPKTNLTEVGKIISNLAALYKSRNNFNKAKEFFEESLVIFKQLAKENPQIYLSYVAGISNNLGILMVDIKENNKAEQFYDEALGIYKQLAKANPKTYLSYVAITLHNLGVLCDYREDYNKAEQFCNEALVIHRQLEKANPKAYLSHIAKTLHNLAGLQKTKNECEKAEESYKEALDKYKQLAEESPRVYLSEVAMTLNSLANLQLAKNEYDKANKSYLKALEIRRQLAKAMPQTYLPDVAMTLNNLGNLQRNGNEYEKAEASYMEALEIRRQLADANPNVYLIHYGDTNINLAVFYKNCIIKKGKSVKYAQNALEAYKLFVPKIPHAVKWSNVAKEIIEYWKNN